MTALHSTAQSEGHVFNEMCETRAAVIFVDKMPRTRGKNCFQAKVISNATSASTMYRVSFLITDQSNIELDIDFSFMEHTVLLVAAADMF